MIEIIGVVGLAVFIWTAFTEDRKRKDDTKREIELEQSRIQKRYDDDEYFLKVQSDFEQLNCNGELPDSVRCKELFIYQELMKPWFFMLLTKSRFDIEEARVLRRDWVTYILASQERARESFQAMMAFEKGRVNDEEEHRRNVTRNKETIGIIENAFAHRIGEEAEKKLAHTRQSPPTRFRINGTAW